MRNITIRNRVFQYAVYSDHHDVDYETRFYQGTETVKRKKYWLFGPIITKEKPVLIFKVDFDIEIERISKKELRLILEQEVKLIERQEQIDRGELV